MPAGTTSAPRTVTCGVESGVKLSHGVAALTSRTRPKASIGISFRSAGAAAPSGEGYTPEEVNREIDAVLIGTPDHWHKTMTLNAVAAGKDVYVEKPVSHRISEGRRNGEGHRSVEAGGVGSRAPGFARFCESCPRQGDRANPPEDQGCNVYLQSAFGGSTLDVALVL